LELEVDSKRFLETELKECRVQLQSAHAATTQAMQLLQDNHNAGLDKKNAENKSSNCEDMPRKWPEGGDAPVPVQQKQDSTHEPKNEEAEDSSSICKADENKTCDNSSGF